MPDLTFRVDGAEPRRSAASHLLFRLRIAEATATPVHAVRLGCQVRIEPARREYETPEREKLLPLFGTPDRWGQTLRDMPWAQVAVSVPAFAGETAVHLPVPCDPDAAAARYCDALGAGDISLLFLFRGTVFHEAAGIGPQVAPIPWDREARYRLPVAVWKELGEEAATP